MVIDVGKRMLEKLGYVVLAASGGGQALDIFRQNREQICLVILDLAMPELDGEATFELLKEIQPEVKVLISSGVCMPEDVGDQLKYGCSGFIQKPFNMNNLSLRVKEIISS